MDEYRKLQQHLNQQAVPFPATKSGAEIRILKHIFTPEEAEIATKLNYQFDSLENIYNRTEKEISIDELENSLENMLQKGGIAFKYKDGSKMYCNVPLILGMYEGQLHRLTKEFLEDFKKYTYHPSFAISFLSTNKSQMRTIPIAKSITPENRVETYDRVQSLIEQSEKRVVVECICSKAAEIKGGKCNATSRKERCLALDDLAVICLKLNIGREITKQEALEILEMNQKDGLVLQVSNSKKPDVVCSCCKCCCGMLDIQMNLPRPLDFWASNYSAKIDSTICNGCGSCETICQVNAIDHDKKKRVTEIKAHRCIGCGNCVVRCKAGAITLVKNPISAIPPDTSEDLYDSMYENKKSSWEKFKMVLKIVFRMKQ